MPAVKVRWRMKTSWRGKLHKPMQPKLVPIPEGMAKRLGQGMMLIPTALELDAMIRKIPRGESPRSLKSVRGWRIGTTWT